MRTQQVQRDRRQRVLRLLMVLGIWGVWVSLLLPMLYADGPSEESTKEDSPSIEAFDAVAIEFFEAKVRPLLVEYCYECHSAESEDVEGGLLLDSRSALLEGGDTGAAIVPGDAEESLLIDAVRHGDLYQMPPDNKLSDDQIAIFEQWISGGAAWTPGEVVATSRGKPGEMDVAARRAEHWAWQPITARNRPEVSSATWSRAPLDDFILARLEAANLQPAPPAERRVLVRRLYMDLVGLPPTPAQVTAFVADTSNVAVERVVDELLASPHFGERWARHWLDLVRYAESRGHEEDTNAANAYQYRDYVIRALNADVPYDQFVHEHVAGDLVQSPRRHPTEGYNESILGTGFWFLGEWVHSPVDIRKDETERFDNMIDVFSKTFMGLTVSCARCHEHKFDAITQEDYYALGGFLQSSGYRQFRFESVDHNRQIAEELAKLDREYKSRIIAQVVAERRDSIEDAAAYLSVALDATDRAAAEELAASGQLDATRLAAWIDEVQRARDEASHVLNGLVGDAAATRLRTEQYQNERANSQVVADYTNTHQRPVDWNPNSVVFGTGPTVPGDVLLSRDAASPVERVVALGSVRRDPLWNDLVEAEGSERDASRMSSWLVPGHSFRTPTFDVTASHLYYLVRGSGHGYVVVDSHRMNRGPLHGKLAQSFKDEPAEGEAKGAWRWVGHDLRRYPGNNAHVEFTTEGDEPLEVRLVVLADAAPTAVSTMGDVLSDGAGDSASATVERVATLQQRLVTAVDALAVGAIADGDDATGLAALADWALRSPGLFPPTTVGAYTELLNGYWQRRDEIAARIKTDSRVAMAMWDGTGRDEYLLVRGNSRTPADVMPRRFLEAIAGDQPMAIQSGSGRLELARAMTDAAANPFVPRVFVNRVWQHLFGVGLVPSVDNFGVLGQPPTHPELLDHLADEFVRDGWSVKRLIRRLVLSGAYQMSSRVDPVAAEADPDNTLLHHARVRRLEGEAIRDAMLAVSGRLDLVLYGPSVPVHLTDFMKARGIPKTSGPLDGDGRRSIYIAVRRNFITPMMLAFDTPIPFTTIGRRNTSNVPSQALILLNDPLVAQQAALWGERAVGEGPADPAQRVDWMYESAFSRAATDAERTAALTFLETQGLELGLEANAWRDDARVWGDLGHVLFNVKEFIFVR